MFCTERAINIHTLNNKINENKEKFKKTINLVLFMFQFVPILIDILGK